MRRVARKKRGEGNKLAGLQSYENIMKSQALRRMQEGLSRILGLHTAVELSSICGCLRLKPQQKGNNSIEQIMRYASAHEEMVEDRTKHILSFMWEGALWEYLHSIGHPIHNMRLDPRDTIYEIWKRGGLLDSNNVFAPHFIAREVKKRNEWVQSDDIQKRLEALQEAQNKAKVAERKVISEHDYTNILDYFNMMSSLRRMETNVRDYLISELEISRSRIDSLQDQSKLLRGQLSENEKQFMSVAETLNVKLANAEFSRDRAVRDRLNMESYLFRLNGVIDSYIASESNREELHGGTMQALKPRQIEKWSPILQETVTKLQQYREQRDLADDNLRVRSRCHIYEIEQLKNTMQDMEKDYQLMEDQHTHAVGKYNNLLQLFVLSERKVKRLEEQLLYQVKTSWRSAADMAGDALVYKQRIHSVKPVLVAGLTNSNPQVVNMSWAMITALQLAPTAEEYSQYENIMLMKREEVLSKKFEQQEKAREAMFASNPKTKKKGATKRGGTSTGASSPVKPKGKSKNDDASATGRSVASASSGGTAKKSSSPKKGGLALSKPGSASAMSVKSGASSPAPSKPSTPSLTSPSGKKATSIKSPKKK
jgi:hypothetical protein